IQQRNAKRVIIFSDGTDQNSKKENEDNDPYSEYQIPDDLMW
ncbi:MAG: DUF2058 domain-containing protein, partial [Gammaproteobacteria bacterium]|nr:DUF2058 domain-containing protein [Gammaproteobacteria bacterium]